LRGLGLEGWAGSGPRQRSLGRRRGRAYAEELRRATLARWKGAQASYRCSCFDVAPVASEGWSVTREAWIRPLDLASLAALLVALVLWVTGRPPSRAE
jgi:hypothetical protein